MKYSEKMQLLLKGVKMDEIKALEEQEAHELEEEQKKHKESNDEVEKALEAANSLVKELEAKLEAKDDELRKKDEDIEALNNKRTIEEQPTESKASDVFKELFKPTKEV